MRAAEHLYLSGYISYPRTETTSYPSTFKPRNTLASVVRVMKLPVGIMLCISFHTCSVSRVFHGWRLLCLFFRSLIVGCEPPTTVVCVEAGVAWSVRALRRRVAQWCHGTSAAWEGLRRSPSHHTYEERR